MVRLNKIQVTSGLFLAQVAEALVSFRCGGHSSAYTWRRLEMVWIRPKKFICISSEQPDQPSLARPEQPFTGGGIMHDEWGPKSSAACNG